MKVKEKFMQLSLDLAVKGKGKTSPNPMVGAVVVKNNNVVGYGYHKKFGASHAEVLALNMAKDKAYGGTLYVNLEPCSTFGKTPPCVKKVITSGIKKVVIAMRDPNPINRGKGIRILRSHGIKVSVGLLNKEALLLNRVFEKYITKKLPFITVKIAQSLDGKIATERGESKWITTVSSRKYVHKLREEADAIMVGINTVIKDDPLLTSRLKGAVKQPLKVIVDSRLKISPDANIFSKKSSAKTIAAVTRYASAAKIKKISKYAGVLIIKGRNKKVNLTNLMKTLANIGVTNILVEGGGNLIASLLKKKLIDQILFFIAPKIIGGKNAPTSVEGKGILKASQAVKLKGVEITRFGEDILLTGSPVYQ